MTIDQLKAYKRKAKAQRDNWKRRAMVYRSDLKYISDHFECCGKCSGAVFFCPVGYARASLIVATDEKEAGT